MQINKYNILENRNQVDHDYKVEDNVMLTNHAAYKYKRPYKFPFVITRCFTNGMLSMKYVPIQIRHNIRQIKPYKSDAKVEDINPKNMCDGVKILSPVINFYTMLKPVHRVYNWATHKNPGVNSYRLCT